ncbi:helix-turn-helix transcriptional regulator [Olivibacter ginsenosidimutans]|uniref:Helix-turn-helix transcriptional regulator n=1 Tax=Olivibacter ginsenosidimutans TaxID=1176537 RepID=A0ABP9ABQ7_9SPHI
METITNTLSLHKGRKIERIRKLRGWTQTTLGEKLNITKQAVSKLEQSVNISDEKLKDIAEALEVTFDGLKNFSEENVLYNTNNFYENCGVNATNISANIENVHNPLKEMIEMFERQLQAARIELIDALKNKK